MQTAAERADVFPGLPGLASRARWFIFRVNMMTFRLTPVLAEQEAGLGVQNADPLLIPQQKGQVAVRQMQGGVAALDDACGMALESGNLEYHFVRKYLERRAPFPALLRKVDPLIRELTHYRDLIAARSEPTPGEPSE